MLEKLYQKLPKDLTLIHAFVGGSSLHGAKLTESSDTDYYGVFIEPAVKSLGLDCFEHFCTTSSGQDYRNGPDDVDINTYSLRQWAQQACKGNPTALSFLYADNRVMNDQRYHWGDVCWNRERFLSKKAAKAFHGFAYDQMQRLLGNRGNGKHGQRPGLINVHGYDTKAAMHAIRLLGEGIELMETGYLTYPRPNKDFLIEVRGGKFSLEIVADIANNMMSKLDAAAEGSDLPERVDRERVSNIITEIYMDHYRGNRG